MRPDEFFIDSDVTRRTVDVDLLDQLRRGPIPNHGDIEVAVALARLVHDELEHYGTDSGNEMDDDEVRLALRSLRATLERVGITDFEMPFRDFSTFYGWWVGKGAKGSWQARRDLLHEVFDPLHDRLAVFEDRSVASTLVDPITPHTRTGWNTVDVEIGELRRHFQGARTPQDYRAVGLDCVAVTEALSRCVYDVGRHLRQGEEEPPVANTKQRLDRVVEDSAPGSDNAAIRKMAKAVIELAQHVKHSATPTRREAGIAADAVIQLANLLRRLNEPE